VNILVTEESFAYDRIDPPATGASRSVSAADASRDRCGPGALLGHLDKSHLTVHTYPEFHPELDISTFRVDIELATCGKVSPLSALNT
jgi:S-adenosylmethionine decarboxylase